MKTLGLSRYWWCQLIGWGLVVVYWLQYPQADLPYFIFVGSLLLQATWQIVATDQYRRLVHRKGWLQLPLKRLSLVVAIAWVALTAQYLTMTYLSFRFRYASPFSQSVWMGALAGGVRYHAIWLLLFHSYHLARQRTAATGLPEVANPPTAPAAAPPIPTSQRLFLPNERGGHFVDLADIHLIRTYGHYLRVYHTSGTDLLKERISQLETQLPSHLFFRANRSEIIRITAVEQVKNQSRGRYQLTLLNGEEVIISEARAKVWRQEKIINQLGI